MRWWASRCSLPTWVVTRKVWEFWPRNGGFPRISLGGNGDFIGEKWIKLVFHLERSEISPDYWDLSATSWISTTRKFCFDQHDQHADESDIFGHLRTAKLLGCPWQITCWTRQPWWYQWDFCGGKSSTFFYWGELSHDPWDEPPWTGSNGHGIILRWTKMNSPWTFTGDFRPFSLPSIPLKCHVPATRHRHIQSSQPPGRVACHCYVVIASCRWTISKCEGNNYPHRMWLCAMKTGIWANKTGIWHVLN